MFLQKRIEGVSGRSWIVDEREPAAISRRTTPFLGWAEDDEGYPVWPQRLIHGDDWQDDRDHMRRAFEIAQIPAIENGPVDRRPDRLLTRGTRT